MSLCEHATSFTALELPTECADLAGLVHADLAAVVSMLTQRFSRISIFPVENTSGFTRCRNTSYSNPREASTSISPYGSSTWNSPGT